MDHETLQNLLRDVASGNATPDAAAALLRDLPYEDLGYAKIDHHRELRKGYPETIFCQNKTPEQVVAIAAHMREKSGTVLGTRCSRETLDAMKAAQPDAVINELARTFTITTKAPPQAAGTIAIVCAGTSDLPVAEEARVTCELLGNPVDSITDIGVAGIHRLLHQRERLNRANVIICCAGMEGALPSVLGGLVQCPVIAVPTSVGYGASFGGLAALLGMLNSCATGVTVVNIDNGFGAAVAASTINRMAERAL